MLQRKAQEAQERGESVPNIDGMEVGPRRLLSSGIVCLSTFEILVYMLCAGSSSRQGTVQEEARNCAPA